LNRFHQKSILVPDLEDGAAYTTFLKSLKNRQFKFSFLEEKKTSLAEAPQKVGDFIRATKIYAETADDPRKNRVVDERNLIRAKRR